MSRGPAAILAVVAFAAAPAVASANEAEAQLIGDAVGSYAEGLDTAQRDLRLEHFRHAERLFARVAAGAPHNAELYTNLGNAALQAEHLGAAVLAYRRALQVDPDHPRATQNLEYARTLLPEWVPKPATGGLLDTFFFWHRTVSRADRALGAALSFLLAGVLVACGLRFAQTGWRNAAILPGLVWIALLASVAIEASQADAQLAVMTADETVARAADSALAPAALPAPLPAGAEVEIVESRSPWLRVRLANGRDAWLMESSLQRVAGD